MAPGPAPLHEAAIRIGKVGSAFHGLYERTKIWPWPFSGLQGFFHQGYVECYEMAHWLYTANSRIESLDWDAFIWSPGAWILVRMGADIGRAVHYRHAPWAWMIWKFRREHLLLDALLSGHFWWIRDYIIGRWPVLRDISIDPQSWIWDKIKARWRWVDELIYHPGRWLLVMCGADIGRAEYYRHWPWGWFVWQFRHHHPPFDALLSRDTYWLWNWFRESIDRYLDNHIDWLVRTCGRIINMIWEARI